MVANWKTKRSAPNNRKLIPQWHSVGLMQRRCGFWRWGWGWNIVQVKKHSNGGQAVSRVRASNRFVPVDWNRHGIAVYQTLPATYFGKSISYVARVVMVIGGTILLLRVRL